MTETLRQIITKGKKEVCALCLHLRKEKSTVENKGVSPGDRQGQYSAQENTSESRVIRESCPECQETQSCQEKQSLRKDTWIYLLSVKHPAAIQITSSSLDKQKLMAAAIICNTTQKLLHPV